MPMIPGADIAGEIVALGAAADRPSAHRCRWRAQGREGWLPAVQARGLGSERRECCGRAYRALRRRGCHLGG
jgi:hypothetical protein